MLVSAGVFIFVFPRWSAYINEKNSNNNSNFKTEKKWTSIYFMMKILVEFVDMAFDFN